MVEKIWFTSDTHFGQQRTLDLTRRPFESVEEMDQTIIDNWNKTVGKNDVVFHLGDFGDYNRVRELNGKVVLLYGNYERNDHNKDLINVLTLLDMGFYQVSTKDSLKLTLPDRDVVYSLVHEPSHMQSYTFNLYGHIHRAQMVRRNGLNVGTDCHFYKPISVDTVEFFKNAIQNHYDDEAFMP